MLINEKTDELYFNNLLELQNFVEENNTKKDEYKVEFKSVFILKKNL